jgi:hypothetical protein
MRRTTTAILLVKPLLLALGADSGNEAPKSVFLRNSEIYVAEAGSMEARQLTTDGLPKSFPVWSKDGTRIAFERGAEGRALADLVTMRPDGTGLQVVPFRPIEANVLGMRFVEGIEWISDQRVVVYGGVNPSTVEYAVVDLAAGKEVKWYAVDGFEWTASPDGSHAAYVGGIPHFTPEADRRPQLCLDDECVMGQPFRGYPQSGSHAEFGTPPVWSPDGKAVAIATENYATKARAFIVRPLNGRPSAYPFPAGVSDPFQLAWDSKGLVVTSGSLVWRLRPGASALAQVDEHADATDLARAGQMRAALARTLAKGGVADADFWCESCPLRTLPRRRTNNPSYGSWWRK